jgi:hypothetical protein
MVHITPKSSASCEFTRSTTIIGAYMINKRIDVVHGMTPQK